MLQRKTSTLKRKFPSIPIFKLRNKQLSLSNRNILTKHLRYVSSGTPLASIVALLFLFGLAFNPNSGFVYAEESDGNYGIDLQDNAPTAATALTIGGEATNAVTNVGLGSIGYRKHTVKIVANDVTGYTLSINGPTNLTGSTIVTGAENKTAASMANNTWGYYYGTSSDESTVAYQSFTGSAVNLETSDSAANTDKTTNLIFAAKFGDQAVAGHYTASVILSLAATPKQINTYSLSYNTNGGSTAPTSTSCTTAAGVASCNVTITDTIPAKANNEFLGWSTSPNAAEADSNYAEGKTVSISANTTLYAIWKSLGSGLQTIQYMQDVTSALCAATPEKTQVTLTDNRDNNTYTVAKLDDGKCWMTENLRLMDRTITSDDSDVSRNWIVPASSGPSAGENNVYYNDDATYGAYYGWCTATAETCSGVAQDKSASESICPKGWRLPTYGEYQALFRTGNSWNNDGRMIGGAFFPAAGGVWESSLVDVNIKGSYWSSTAASAGAYRLYFDSGKVYDYYSTSTSNGFPIRCIAR